MLQHLLLTLLTTSTLFAACDTTPGQTMQRAPAASPARTGDGAKDLQAVRQRLRPLLQARGLQLGDPVLLRIFKAESALEVWMQPGGQGPFVLLDTWDICRWSGDLGPKLREGDGQAPEGFYTLTTRQLHPGSRYHLAFNLGFPNAFDQHHGRTGSFLMIHGACVSIGCYAMTDPGIEPLYALVEDALANGQPHVPVHAFPFRLTDDNLQQHAQHPWADHWRNLQEGDRLFQKERRPPRVDVSPEGRYRFTSPTP